MRRTILIVTAVLLVASAIPAAAQQGTSAMLNSKHDLGTGSTGPSAAALVASNADEICVFCHTPHQTTTAAGQLPLWNHQWPAATTYGVYSNNTSPTLDADLAGAEVYQALGGAGVSMLCMSCHDGTVAVGSLFNPPNSAGGSPLSNSVAGSTLNAVGSTANLGTSLVDDHPVNFLYGDSITNGDTELYTAVGDAVGAAVLFGGTVQCASCHDPHDTSQTAFLVETMVDSALCVNCHMK